MVNEVIIVRCSVLNDTGKPIHVGSHFAPLFRSETLDIGRTSVRFPVSSTEYKRLFTEFEKRFPQVTCSYGAQGIEEY